MALKSLQCPNCLGQIDTFDETTKMGTCPYCHSVIRDVAELQKQFEVTISGTVKVEGIDGAEDQLERAAGFVKLGELDEAEKILDQYTARYPMDFEGWSRLLELSMDAFDKAAVDTDAVRRREQKVLRCIKNMVLLASDDGQRLRMEDWKTRVERKRDEKKRLVDGIDSEVAEMESKKRSAALLLEQKQNAYREASDSSYKARERQRGCTVPAAVGIIGAIVGITLSGSTGYWFLTMPAGAIIGAFVGGAILEAGVASSKKSEEESRQKAEAARLKHDSAQEELRAAKLRRDGEAALLGVYSKAASLLEES